MRRIGLAMAALLIFGAFSAPASAQSDEDKQKLRKELIRKIDARLRKLRQELVRDVDRALGMKSGKQPRTTNPKVRTSKKRGFLGISIRPLKPGMRELLGVPKGVGVLIDEVVPRSAAHVAGLRRTDVLLAWGRTRIKSEKDLAGVAGKGRAGQTVKLVVLREGRKMAVEATLTARGVPAKGTPKKLAKKGKGDLNKMLEEAMKGGGSGLDPEQLQKMMEQFQKNPEMQEMLQQAMKQFQDMMKDPAQRKRIEKMMQDMGMGGSPEDIQKRLKDMMGGKKGTKKTPKKGKKDDIDDMLDDLLGKGGKKGTKKTTPKKTDSKRGFLGVSVRPLDETMRTQLNLPAGEGVLVDSVVEGSAAAKAGLKRFDVLVAVGKQKIGGIEDIKKTLGGKAAGTKLTLTIVRKGKRSKVKVTLAPRPEEGWK